MLCIIRPLHLSPGYASKRGRAVAVLSHSLAAFGQRRGAVLTAPVLTVEVYERRIAPRAVGLTVVYVSRQVRFASNGAEPD